MACIWTIQLLVILFMYTDLHRIMMTPVARQPGVNVPNERSRSVNYDEDIYKQINVSENCDKVSINSHMGSRSKTPLSDPDDLIETAEDFIEGHQRSQSCPPYAPNSSFTKPRSGSYDDLKNQSVGTRNNSAAKGQIAMVSDYGSLGSLEGGALEEGRGRTGSEVYAEQRESSLSDYLQGKSRLRFMYRGESLQLRVHSLCTCTINSLSQSY